MRSTGSWDRQQATGDVRGEMVRSDAHNVAAARKHCVEGIAPVDGDVGSGETATLPPPHSAVDRFQRAGFAERVVIPLARAFGRYSRARVFGEDLIPGDGPVIYVGKHPRSYLYLETALLGVFAFWDSGRPPFRVLESAHASAQRAPLLSWIRHHVGAIPATQESALEVLRQGESLLIFPGGTRELYGAPDELRWRGREGYARLAVAAQVPVVPFAIAGADQQHPIRLSIGRSSVWLPPIPLPVPLDFHFGAPLSPPPEPVGSDIRGAVAEYAAQIHAATAGLLAAAIAQRRKRV